MLSFYDTMAREKREFVPIERGKVGIYSCGPTVYDYAHIGNLSAFIFVDLLKRWLLYRGYEVYHVMNITDVDDKTIRGSNNCGETLQNFTEKYTKIFLKELELLNILPADVYPKATEHITEMVNLIQILLEKDYAYEQDGSVYFRIKSFPDYGRLAQLKIEDLNVWASGDSDEYTKEDIRDFVLWKSWKPKEDGDVFWDTTIGRGRPGWHIECSAMSMKYLGETFDIHTGGSDLIFPHHQNEIAQSEAATGKRFVNYWLHREHLKVNGQKMSKSAGTGLFLKDIARDPLEVMAFRYLVISNHYRSQLNFTSAALAAARKTVARLRSFYFRLGDVKAEGSNVFDEILPNAYNGFIRAMENDLNTPQVMAAIFNVVNMGEKFMTAKVLSSSSAVAIRDFLRKVDAVLGVIVVDIKEGAKKLTLGQQLLIEERSAARVNKDWKRSDEIREILKSQGIFLEDTANGTRQVKA